MCYCTKSVVYEFFQLRSKVDVLWMVLYCRLRRALKKINDLEDVGRNSTEG